MGKVKTTDREIRSAYNNIIKIGYCDAQHLLQYENPTFYTCGVYGWKADFYVINDNTIISTGYAPIGDGGHYEITRKYEKKAQDIVYAEYPDNNYSKEIAKRTKKLRKLIEKYCSEVLNKDIKFD